MNPYNRHHNHPHQKQHHQDQSSFDDKENDEIVVTSMQTTTPRPVSKERDYCPNAIQRNPYHNCTAIASSSTSTWAKHRPPQTALQLLHASRLEQQLDFLLLLDDIPFPQQKHGDPRVPPWNSNWLSLQSGVYEIAGAAGSGKTQLALSLCVRAAATATTPIPTTTVQREQSPSSIRSIYIALHKMNMISRIAQRLHQQIPSSSSSILQRIWIKPCANTEDLFELLQSELPTIIRQQHPHVRVIILDGIADLFRGIEDATQDPNHIVTRSAELFRVGRLLQNLIHVRTNHPASQNSSPTTTSTTYTPLSIVVLNQVSAIFQESSTVLPCHCHPTGSASSSDPWKPALGLSWSHCVHQRFRIHRTVMPSGPRIDVDTTNTTTTTTRNHSAVSRRTLTLAHSSQYATPQSIEFVITTQNGCQAIPL
jgi:predicted ATPase